MLGSSCWESTVAYIRETPHPRFDYYIISRCSRWRFRRHFGLLKGQMNQNIEIVSFVALPSPNTKKEPITKPIEFFFPSFYRKIKEQNPSISEDFTKTFLKWPRDGLETVWRQCWSLGRLKCSAQASAHPLSQAEERENKYLPHHGSFMYFFQ